MQSGAANPVDALTKARGVAAVKTPSTPLTKAEWRPLLAHGTLREDMDTSTLPQSRQEAIGAGVAYYFTNQRCRHGHLAPRRVRDCWCLVCARLARLKGGPKSRTPEQRRLRYRRYVITRPVKMLLQHARRNARRRNIPISITEIDLVLGERCPCCNRIFEIGGPRAISAPSVDRFDSKLGYLPDNINVICWGCNNIKGSATAEELLMVAHWMLRKDHK